MGSNIALLGDTSTHGGTIVTASSKMYVQDKKVARVTDILDCPIHGHSEILDGSPRFRCADQSVARSGSHTACGAIIIGSGTVLVE